MICRSSNCEQKNISMFRPTVSTLCIQCAERDGIDFQLEINGDAAFGEPDIDTQRSAGEKDEAPKKKGGSKKSDKPIKLTTKGKNSKLAKNTSKAKKASRQRRASATPVSSSRTSHFVQVS